MKKILFLFIAIVLSVGSFVSAQETISSRSGGDGSLLWWDGANPWYRACDTWNVDRPDRNQCGVWPGTTGPNNINIGHNDYTNMVLNGAWFKVQTLTLEVGASDERTFTANPLDLSAGLSLYAGIVNNANAYHTFITPIGIDAAQVTINAAANNMYFTQPVFLNANEVIFTGSFYTYVEGVVSGTGKLTKQGLGGLALSATNTYSGTTTVSAGTLILAGDLASSAITVESGGLLVIGTPITTGNISINDLTVNVGGVVQVLEGNTLTVNGNLINNGSFTLESSATGTGSLIPNGSLTGTFNVERYMPQYSTDADGWHFLSSPVSSQAISAFHTAGSGDDFYKYEETTGMWINRTADGGVLNGSFETNFGVGTGYLVAYQNPTTKSFTGSLNNSDVSISGLTDQGGADDGWHLIGNPFPSAIQWNKTGGSWSTTNIGGIAKVVNGSTGNYSDLNTDDIIPAAQGFIVEVDGGTPGSLILPKAARTHSTDNWYKNQDVQERLQLEVHGGSNSFSDITTLYLNEDATNEYDSQFDSHKLYGMVTAPQLFTKMGEENYSTNSFNYERSEKSIPLAFRAGTNGEHTIEIITNTMTEVDGLYLEDLVENVTIDLSKTDTYSFSANTEDNEDRFQIHFGTTAVEDLQESNLQAYINGNNLIIIGEEGNAQLSIFDIQGKQLVNESIKLSASFQKRLSLQSGIYIVKIQTAGLVKTRKVIIK